MLWCLCRPSYCCCCCFELALLLLLLYQAGRPCCCLLPAVHLPVMCDCLRASLSLLLSYLTAVPWQRHIPPPLSCPQMCEPPPAHYGLGGQQQQQQTHSSSSSRCWMNVLHNHPCCGVHAPLCPDSCLCAIATTYNANMPADTRSCCVCCQWNGHGCHVAHAC